MGDRLCDYNAFPGWWCSRTQGHTGPCALRPKRGHAVRVAFRNWWREVVLRRGPQ